MIRTVILGLGKVAERIHLPACQALSALQIVGASEPNAERGRAMQQRFGLPVVFEDSQTLMEKLQPELVIIGTPPDTHRELCLMAFAYGADVLCEKPFVRNLEAADEVLAAAKRTGCLLAVNNQYRYMEIYRKTQAALAQGGFGRLFFLQCWQQMFHPPAFEGTSWRADLKQSTLFEFGSHPLDLLSFFFGALPEAVTAYIPRVRPEYDADVLVQMTLRFPEERLATLALNRVSHAPERYLEMRLDCEKASLRLSVGGVARASLDMVRHQGRSIPRPRLSFVKGGEARIEAHGRSRILAQEPLVAVASATAEHLRAFLALRSRRDDPMAYVAAEHARSVLRVVLAGYESARTGQTVLL
ncbi:Gfo/Idh/MocA family protein [Anthocerotibacter panamensis]|uniref:Gfo/Idh/MocA family protein n=1 Tax=Anthocerotibacter panamensis TaxID=2857077 RepID=UPI001C40887E|nr:Gfo/Idh/MocA family oxidoreductase [Anthocerotibacter panamensis]